MLGVVDHAYNPSILEAKIRRMEVRGQKFTRPHLNQWLGMAPHLLP
jgi:hypothetical protein